MFIEDNALRHDGNNLTFARLVLASAVIYSHCLWQLTGSDADVLTGYLGAPISTFAVDGFFFISGFLVYRSLSLKPDVIRFGIARFARLWPGLAIMCLFVSVVGLFFTTAPLKQYLTTTVSSFIFGNLSFVAPSYTLPGIECAGSPCNVNGSLWTISWEVRCYLMLAILSLAGLLGKPALARLVLPLTFVYAVVVDIPAVQNLVHTELPNVVAFYIERIDRLWIAFALGIAAYAFRDRIPLRWSILAVLIIADVLAHLIIPSAGVHVRSVLAGYLILSLGFLTVRETKPFSSRWPDYSYGMYIYAFPVMLVLYKVGVSSLGLLIVLDFLVTLAFAAMSWHLVEKPAMDWFKTRYATPSSARIAARSSL